MLGLLAGWEPVRNGKANDWADEEFVATYPVFK